MTPGAAAGSPGAGTSPEPVPEPGRAAPHLSEPFDPYAEAARLELELEQLRSSVVRMALALAEERPDVARRLMDLTAEDDDA